MDISYLGQTSFRIKGKSTVVTVESNGSIQIADREGTSPYIVHGPGEYEVKGVGVIGMTIGGKTVYRIEVEQVAFVHLGGVTTKLSAADIDSLDGVDILMVPVSEATVSIINEVEPSIVIPMVYTPETLAAFCKELGKSDVSSQPKLSITKDKIPEQMQLVVLV